MCVQLGYATGSVRNVCERFGARSKGWHKASHFVHCDRFPNMCLKNVQASESNSSEIEAIIDECNVNVMPMYANVM